MNKAKSMATKKKFSQGDGANTKQFRPVLVNGNVNLSRLPRAGVSSAMRANSKHAPQGDFVAWGLPFNIAKPVLLLKEPVTVKIAPTKAPWLVFLHTSDIRAIKENADGFISPMRGSGQLNEHAADYVLIYADGAEARSSIRRRHQIGPLERQWGENCFQAVPDRKN